MSKTFLGLSSVFLLTVMLAGCSAPKRSSFEAPWNRRYRTPAVKPKSMGVTLISWPVRPNSRITRGFLTGRGRPHHGVDLAAHKGAPILAAHRGRVIFAGKGYRGYGKLIILDDGKGWSSFYAHLDRFIVKEGQFVDRGQVIGTMGRTGRATGVHLHFELRKNKVPVNPIRFLP